MRTRTIVVTLVVIAAIAALAVFAGGKRSKPEAAPPAVPDYWPTAAWRTSTPEQQGFDSAALAAQLLKLRDDGVAIDSLLIVRNGYVMVDAYFAPYDGSFPHDMASVTKSITTTLVGIAAGQGKLDLDAPMLSFFPDRTIANIDARKQAITVRHLAGMTNGMQSGCLNGDEETLDAMRAAPDWIQQALDREMMRDPGLAFCYDSPGMHILSAILQQATGMPELVFARQELLEPLGIRDMIWETDPQGYTDGWGDSHLLPRDAAKIGLLFLHGGLWDGQQIVPADWVAQAVTAHLDAGDDSYGYGWWVSDDSYAAIGRGGQHIKVYPGYNTVIVVTAGGFDFDQLEPLLAASVKDLSGPLPANAQGEAALQQALVDLARPRTAFPVTALPPMAATISGRTYMFGEDAEQALELRTMTLEFSGDTEAMMKIQGPADESTWPFGLDGTFRIEPDGRALRGYWSDESTLVFEIFDIGTLTFHAHFEGDGVTLTSDNFAGRFEGTSKKD